MATKIVITGGPGSGKTTIIDALSGLGHLCLPEISRELIMEARKNGIEQLFLTQPLLFSEMLLEGRRKQFFQADIASQERVFIDRGIPDILAYMHYIGDAYPSVFDTYCRDHKYDRVFLLPPWEEIYVSDEARYENFEQAKLIFSHLRETYSHYGYELIEVPTAPTMERVQFILDSL